MIGAHSPARVWRLASVVRRMFGDKLESIFVGHSQYSFNAERTDHDKPLVLYDSPILEAQRLLSLVELSSPRNYNPDSPASRPGSRCGGERRARKTMRAQRGAKRSPCPALVVCARSFSGRTECRAALLAVPEH